MKGYVDKDACVGCGICFSVCPKIFEMDEDGKAKAVDQEIPAAIVGNAKDAEMQCPVSAIKVE